MSTNLRELLSDYPVVIEFPVSWSDMDAFGHVNNKMYFRYFEDARFAYFNSAGVADMSQVSGVPAGIAPVLAETSCRFKVPLFFPDTVAIGARVVDIAEDRFTVEHAVASEKMGLVVAEGKARVVTFDFSRQEKAPLPESWLRAIQAVEARVGGAAP